jgi:hypothetical protein
MRWENPTHDFGSVWSPFLFISIQIGPKSLVQVRKQNWNNICMQKYFIEGQHVPYVAYFILAVEHKHGWGIPFLCSLKILSFLR